MSDMKNKIKEDLTEFIRLLDHAKTPDDLPPLVVVVQHQDDVKMMGNLNPNFSVQVALRLIKSVMEEAQQSLIQPQSHVDLHLHNMYMRGLIMALAGLDQLKDVTHIMEDLGEGDKDAPASC